MSDDGIRSNAPRLIYLLSLAGVLFWPATLVGLVMAYMNRGTVMLVWLGWTVTRCIKGMLAFDRRQALPAGIGWGFG